MAEFDSKYLSHKQDGEHLKKKSSTLKEVDQKLEQVLEKYGLDEALRAFRIVRDFTIFLNAFDWEQNFTLQKYKYENSKIYAEANLPNSIKEEEYKKGRIFADKRLEQLWNGAKNDDDLVLDELDGSVTSDWMLSSNQRFADFYEKLKALDSKITAYNELHVDHKEHRSNHIEADEEYDRTAVALKQLNREIEQGIVDLKEILTGVRENPFHEPAARKLWSKVGCFYLLSN